MGKPLVALVLLLALAALAACGAKTGALGGTQYHTPLQCPCPTIAPLAQFALPSEAGDNNAYYGAIVTGPDGNLWVPEFDANKIARVTVSGTITEFPVPTAGAGPCLMQVGPDGNLWFTECNFNTIGRITPGGTITEFPLPPPLSTAPFNLQDITAGPDGNLWFVHGGANVIGVMSISGTLLATYQIPSPNPNSPVTGSGEASFIITGPDHNLWFVEEAASKIGRITTSGVITEFPTLTPNASPKNLAIGADGNLWFPEIGSGLVGRITMSGVITEYPMVADPTIHRLRRVAVTPDGSMWVVEAMIAPPWDSEIGKFDTTGTELDLWSFPNGEPRPITAGPDGNPWFVDEANNAVVRL
jgi:streptogramin lyase